MSPTHQDLSNYTTFSQIKSRVPVPLNPPPPSPLGTKGATKIQKFARCLRQKDRAQAPLFCSLWGGLVQKVLLHVREMEIETHLAGSL